MACVWPINSDRKIDQGKLREGIRGCHRAAEDGEGWFAETAVLDMWGKAHRLVNASS